MSGKADTSVVDVARSLRRSLLFADVADSTVASLAAGARVRRVQRGALLIMEGDAPAAMYVLADGFLRVFTTSLDGVEPTLTVLFPGDHVGELGMLDGVVRSASVGALRTSTVIDIRRDTFVSAYECDGAISRTLVAHLARRLRSTSERLTDLTILDLGARLAKYLGGEAELAAARGSTQFELLLNQSELGQLLGGARQSINQLLAILERDGILTVDGRQVTVIDTERLAQRAALRW